MCIDFPLYIFVLITSKKNRVCIKLLLDFDSQCHYDQMNQRPNKRDFDSQFELVTEYAMHHYIIAKYTKILALHFEYTPIFRYSQKNTSE